MTVTTIMMCVVLAVCVTGAVRKVQPGLSMAGVLLSATLVQHRARPVVRARHMGSTKQQHDRFRTAADPRDTHRPSYTRVIIQINAYFQSTFQLVLSNTVIAVRHGFEHQLVTTVPHGFTGVNGCRRYNKL